MAVVAIIFWKKNKNHEMQKVIVNSELQSNIYTVQFEPIYFLNNN